MSNEKSQSVDGEEQGLAFPARELVSAREAAGLSQKDVARELRLSDKYIDAIENADFSALPSMVFARGYIRSYTKLLQLDIDRYLSIFDQLYGQRPSREYAGVSGIEPQARLGDPVVKWTTRVFILVVIAASIWWWKTQQVSEGLVPELVANPTVEVEAVDGTTVVIEPEVVVDSHPVIVPVTVIDAAQADAVSGDAPQVLETSESPATSVEPEEALQHGAVTTDEALTESATETVVALTEVAAEAIETVAAVTPAVDEQSQGAEFVGIGRLEVSFSDECWVSVEDANGELIAQRVKPAGSKLDVSGPLPLNVRLGNAAAVQQVLFNGEPVSIENVSRANVVRMSLPLAQ